MKQRFSSLDVKVISRELNSALTSLRVSNIYDLSSRIFLFKLAKPDNRKQFIVDSGFRCHLTEYSRTTETRPSGFVQRLRKSLKSRRVTSVSQIGTDRIIDIEFSEGQYHLFLEFFAGGNIILTDREYTILALFRQVSEGGDQEEVKVGLKYTLENKQNIGGVPELSVERLRETLQKAGAAAQEEEAAPKKSKKKPVDVLRKALSQGFPEYPPLLLDHAFAVKGFDPATPPEQVLQDEGLLKGVMEVLEEAESVNKHLSVGDKHPGYIVAKEDKAKADGKPEGDETSKKPSLLYEDFHPFKPHQFEGKPGITILEFDGFNKTVDEYFSSIESQKLESRLTEREENARRKLEAARKDHEKRLGALKEVQELHIRKAEAIGANVLRVQEAIDAVNGLIAQGMDWVEIARLIEMEQGRGNPVAKMIKLPLKLYENTITLLLSEVSAEADEEDEADMTDEESESEEEFQAKEAQREAQRESEKLAIDIDLGLSPWANATQYYEQKKVAAVKEKKTIESSTKALKSQEKKVTEDLKRSLKQEKQVLRPARKPFWFEKFIFFISSDGYLVLGGRDAHQNEILYRRYLKKGDIFVHADIEGATPIIVKNKQGTPDAPIPPGTLSQAGNLSVATSVAWDSKAVMSAWWVHANQVSKTTETGELLRTGGFVIKGEKNFLAPSQLVLGFAAMFQISLESIPNHRKHRIQEEDQEQAPPVTEADAERSEAPKARKEQLDNEDEIAKAEQKAENEEDKEEEKADERADGVDGQEESSSSEFEEDRSDETPAENPLQSRDPEPVKADVTAMEKNDELRSGGGGEEEEEHTHDQGEDQEGPDGTATPSENVEQAPASRPEGKRHLSARERRLLRKGKPLDGPASTKDAADGESSTPTTEEPSRSTTPSVAQSTKQTPSPPVRGKKGKAKKAAAKYAHQDEEERELALRLLGSKAKADKAASAAEAKAAREAELEAQRQRRRAQHDRAAEAERKRQALLEEGADAYDEETAEAEAADLAWLPALVGTPLPEDEVLAAIPVCAPWAALGRYKYRAKLQPGTVKKGKAVKEILGRWIVEASPGAKKGKKDESLEDAGVDRATAERMRAREAELIRAWRDVEVVNTVPVGKVRIITGGGGAAGGGGDAKGKGKDKGGKGGKGGKKK
ncbi:hypothetical protein VTN00DRAFT_4671 [Thermoascus crustaceus]|uniref:uncharacterized protein n=1 Tax=Thermoascus crustaceus TaxID=5088 RepID=UPI0037438949